MTLYVNSIGILLLGKPHRLPLGTKIDEAIKDQSFRSYLSNLTPRGKELLTYGIKNLPGLLWADKVLAQGSQRRENLVRLALSIIENGKIPDDLDYEQVIDQLGTPNKEYLEEAIFYLLQDIGMQELDGKIKI